MSILLIVIALVLAIPEPKLQGGTAVPEASPETAALLDVNGETASAVVKDPATGVARYLVAGSELYAPREDGEWQATGQAPERDTLIVDSVAAQVLWAGTGQECLRGGGATQPLMRSDDAGATWTETGAPGLVPLVSWSSAGIVVAYDCSGLQLSRDAGATWTAPEELPLGSQVTAFAVASGPDEEDGLVLLAGITGEGGTSELYRITIDGAGTVAVDDPLLTYYGVGSLEATESGAILVGAPQGVLRSDDGGESWITDRDGLESTTLEEDPIEAFPSDLEPGSFGLAALIAIDRDLFVAGVDGVYHLGNNGDSWQLALALDEPAAALAVNDAGDTLLVQTADDTVLQTPIE